MSKTSELSHLFRALKAPSAARALQALSERARQEDWSHERFLEAVLSAVPIDIVNTMGYEREGPYALSADPPVWDDYRNVISASGLKLVLEPIDKWDFYEAVAMPDHVLTIQTADQQRFANILLSVGVRMD